MARACLLSGGSAKPLDAVRHKLKQQGIHQQGEKPVSESEEMHFDVIIVGGGPSGLACAIHLKQLKPDLAVCVLEKGGEIGAHILSGAVIETRALDELLPDWASMGAPIHTKVTSDTFMFLSKKRALRLPTPPAMRNTGNYIVSLGLVTRWLGEEAQKLGVEIYPGFPAKELLFDADQAVKGVLTGEMGRDKQGTPGPHFQPGMALLAPITVFAEGCRGSLGARPHDALSTPRALRPAVLCHRSERTMEVPTTDPGKVMHTIGWPLSRDCYGGSFLYHLDKTKIAVGGLSSAWTIATHTSRPITNFNASNTIRASSGS